MLTRFYYQSVEVYAATLNVESGVYTYALSTIGSGAYTTSTHMTTATAYAEYGPSGIPGFTVSPPSCTLTYGGGGYFCKRGPDCKQCTIHGGTVQLLYFPISTGTPVATVNGGATTAIGINGTQTKAANASQLVTAVYDGTTLTSPSVYISFATAYAENDCNTTIGTPHTGSIIGLNPDELSSALGNFHALSTINTASGTTALSMDPFPFNLGDLNWPYAPFAWDEQPRCQAFIANTCTVVVSGALNPVIVVPSKVRDFDPAWATCGLDWQGLYDPPKALTPVTAPASPTLAPGTTSSTPAAASSTPAAPTVLATTISVAGVSQATKASTSQSASSSALAAQSEAASSASVPSSQSQASSVQTTQAHVSSASQAPAAFTQAAASSSGNANAGASGLSKAASSAPTSQASTPAVIGTVGSGSTAVTIAHDTSSSNQLVISSAGGATTLQAGSTRTFNGQQLSVDSSGNAVLGSATTISFGFATSTAATNNGGSDQSKATAVATVGSNTIVQNPSGSGLLINGASTLSGGQITTLSGSSGPVTVSGNANGGAVIQSGGIVSTVQPAAVSAAVVTVGSNTIVQDPSGSGLVINGASTLSAGQITILSGSSGPVTVSGNANGGAVIQSGGIFSTIQPAAVSAAVVTVGSNTIAQDPSQSGALVINGQSTLSSGQVTTIQGTSGPVTISGNGNGGAVIQSGGLTSTIQPAATPQYQPVTPVIGGQTLSAGGAAVTQNGATYSQLASGGSVVVASNGVTTTVAATAFGGAGSNQVTTVNGQTVSQISNGVVIGGTTLTNGASAATISGVVYSAASDGQLVVGSQTTLNQPQSSNILLDAIASVANMQQTFRTKAATLVVGSQTYTAIETAGPSYVVLGSLTFSQGGSAQTVNGETVSLGSSGLVVVGGGHTSTIAFSGTHTNGSSALISSSGAPLSASTGPKSSASIAAAATTTTSSQGSAAANTYPVTGMVVALCLALCMAML